MAGIIPNEFSIEKVKYSPLKILENGGKAIWVSYENAPLIFQTPEMITPFGISKWDNSDKGGGKKYTLDMSFKNKESREILNKFYENLLVLDEKLVKDAFENSMSWFKKKSSEAVLKELYTPIIRHAKDKNTGDITDKFPPTFKVALPQKDDKYTFEVYNQDKKQVDLDSLELKGARVTALIQCLGVWIAGTKFGVSWKVLQMKVNPIKKLQGYSFKEIEDDKIVNDDINENDEEIHENDVKKSDNEDPNIVDSDEDELDKKITVNDKQARKAQARQI
jgi:hypothetical protein